MRRTARQFKWFLFPVLVTGLILVSADEGQSQPPPGGGGRGGFGGGGFGGGPPDPDQIWGFMSQGKDSIDLSTNPRMKSSMEKNGDPIPANGILTKDQFKANYARRVAQGGGTGGGRGGMGGGITSVNSGSGTLHVLSARTRIGSPGETTRSGVAFRKSSGRAAVYTLS